MAENRKKSINVPNLRFPEFEREWETVKIREFGSVITGNTPPTNDIENYGNEYSWVSPADLGTEKYITDTKNMLSEKGYARTRRIPQNSILVTCIGSTIGKIGMATKDMATNQQINSIIVNNHFDCHFVYYAIDSQFPKYLSSVSKQAVPIISKSVFEELNNYSTSIDEQKKIGHFLTLIDERISTQIKIIDELKTLMRGLRENLLTQKLRYKEDNENNFPYWMKTNLLNCSNIQSGLSLTQNEKKIGYKVTRIETISNKVIDISKVGYVSTLADLSDYKLNIGDILFSNINSVSHIGKTAIVTSDCNLYHGMNLLRLTPNPKVIKSLFLFHVLNQNKTLCHFRAICNKAVSQASINQTDLGKFSFYIPRLDEQDKIANFLSTIDKKIEMERQLLHKYAKQKKYLLSNLFI
ncbi:restriction endonuclease subunit S [Bacteroidia bacterium]|nr:restriction endonuclease subunit S [Bacteroidia bacterium]